MSPNQIAWSLPAMLACYLGLCNRWLSRYQAISQYSVRRACRVYIEVADALVEDFLLPTCTVLEVLNSSVISYFAKIYNIPFVKIIVVL